FFMITGPTDAYQNFRPLLIPGIGAIFTAFLAVGALIVPGRRVLRGRPELLFLLTLAMVYIVVLFLDNYGAYLRTGQPVAVNGRYLVPVLLPLGAAAALAVAKLLKRFPAAKAVLASVVILLLLQGGGLVAFIVRSDSKWDWPNQTVITVNNGARDILK